MQLEALTAALVLAVPATAQADRYELGKRLVRLERAAAENPERAALAEPIGQALGHFFGLDMRSAGRALDEAWLRLRHPGEPIPDRARWAASLGVTTPARLFDASVESIALELDQVYDSHLPIPESAVFRARLEGAEHGVTSRVDALPIVCRLPVDSSAAGDHDLTWSVSTDSGVLISRRMTVSIAVRMETRLDDLERAIANLKSAGFEKESAKAALRTCKSLTRTRAPETDIPAARLLRESEAAVANAAQGKRHYGADRPGEFWLRVPVAGRSISCRVLVPATDPESPPPLVLALHGAGGSENLFFDGGGGLVPESCASRGWMLVAPRSTPITTPDLPALLDALAQRYTFDPQRVFLIGHSMGAMQAVANACRAPTRFAAVAVLGGGGRVEATDEIDGVSFYVAVGTRDFARGQAEALARSLERNGVAAEFLELPDVGHVLVLQDALPRVFAWLDAKAER